VQAALAIKSPLVRSRAMAVRVERWLDAKLIKSNHPAWREAAARDDECVPLWIEDGDDLAVKKAGFDAIVLEPFKPHADPTVLIDTVGYVVRFWGLCFAFHLAPHA
jgi:hypothetical protein